MLLSAGELKPGESPSFGRLKRRNGFRKIDVATYYVPLMVVGHKPHLAPLQLQARSLIGG
jgi:hypothetical protein